MEHDIYILVDAKILLGQTGMEMCKEFKIFLFCENISLAFYFNQSLCYKAGWIKERPILF